MQNQQQQDKRPYVCPECWKIATLSEVKKLPQDHATLMKAVHADRVIPDHTWKEYDLPLEKQKPKSKLAISDKADIRYKPPNREIVTCGRCGDPGLKYPTYVQHSIDRPPTSPQITDGKQRGWNWERCYYPIAGIKTKTKTESKTKKRGRPRQTKPKYKQMYFEAQEKLQRIRHKYRDFIEELQ